MRREVYRWEGGEGAGGGEEGMVPGGQRRRTCSIYNVHDSVYIAIVG